MLLIHRRINKLSAVTISISVTVAITLSTGEQMHRVQASPLTDFER